MFCENSLFDSLFLVNLSIFPLGFLCVLKKVLYMAIYIVKMEVGTTPKRCEIHSKSQSLMQKTCLFYVSGTLHTCAGSGMRVHALWLHLQADSYVHRQRASLALLFQKQIYLFIKCYIFHFNISQVNLTSNWALNQCQVLEFQHHWRTKA